jgi:hypothetical protein
MVWSDQDRSKTETRPRSWSFGGPVSEYLKTGPDRLVWSSVFVKSPKTGPDQTAGTLPTTASNLSKQLQSAAKSLPAKQYATGRSCGLYSSKAKPDNTSSRAPTRKACSARRGIAASVSFGISET